MLGPFRKQVKIVKLPQMESSKARIQEASQRAGRDTRPGRFTIKGSFIKLPDSVESNSDEGRG